MTRPARRTKVNPRPARAPDPHGMPDHADGRLLCGGWITPRSTGIAAAAAEPRRRQDHANRSMVQNLVSPHRETPRGRATRYRRLRLGRRRMVPHLNEWFPARRDRLLRQRRSQTDFPGRSRPVTAYPEPPLPQRSQRFLGSRRRRPPLPTFPHGAVRRSPPELGWPARRPRQQSPDRPPTDHPAPTPRYEPAAPSATWPADLRRSPTHRSARSRQRRIAGRRDPAERCSSASRRIDRPWPRVPPRAAEPRRRGLAARSQPAVLPRSARSAPHPLRRRLVGCLDSARRPRVGHPAAPAHHFAQPPDEARGRA